MLMMNYIKEVKRQLVSAYQFSMLPGSTKEEPLFEPPDGDYPVTIDGKIDRVRIVDGKIDCCNFDTSTAVKSGGK